MKIRSLLVVAVLATAILCSAGFVKAQATDNSALIAQLMAQIQSLIKQIQALQAAQQNGGSQWCHTFNVNMGYGATGPDFGALMTVLYKESIANFSPENKSAYDEEIGAVVVKLQAKYGILQTGYVGPLTRAKLNTLYGCKKACTEEARQCPDGSYVGRTGPNCEFAQCPKTQCTTDSDCPQLDCATTTNTSVAVDCIGLTNKCVSGKCVSSTSTCPVGCICSGNTTTCPTQPAIKILSPNGGEMYKLGDIITVNWKTSGVSSLEPLSIIRLRAYPNGQEYNLAYNVLNDGQEVITLPSSVSVGAYTLEIKTYVNNVLVFDASDSYFKIVSSVSQCTVDADCPTACTACAINSTTCGGGCITSKCIGGKCVAQTQPSITITSSPSGSVPVGSKIHLAWVSQGIGSNIGIGFCPKGETTNGIHCTESQSVLNTGNADIQLSGALNLYANDWYSVVSGYSGSYGTGIFVQAIGNTFTAAAAAPKCTTDNDCPSACTQGVSPFYCIKYKCVAGQCVPQTNTQPSITVTSPNGGEKWQLASSINNSIYTVNFNASGFAQNDKATTYLQFPDGGMCKLGEFMIYYLNNTSFNLYNGMQCPNIPRTVTYGDGYKIAIFAGDVPGSDLGKARDYSDSTFSLVPLSVSQPSITVTSLNEAGLGFPQGQIINITWNSQNLKPGGTFNITLFDDKNRNGTIVTNLPATQNSYAWKVAVPMMGYGASNDKYKTFGAVTNPGIDLGNFKVSVYYDAKTGNSIDNPSDTNDNYFKIYDASVQPLITVTSPNGGETWRIGETQNIRWSSNGGDTVSAQLVFPDQSSCYLNAATASAGNLSYNLGSSCPNSSKAIVPGQYKIALSLMKGATNIAGDSSDNSFSIVASAITNSTPLCPTGTNWNATIIQPVSIDSPYGRGYCTGNPICPTGTTWNSTIIQPVSGDSPYGRGFCVGNPICPTGTNWNATIIQPVSIDSPYGRGYCTGNPICPTGTTWNSTIIQPVSGDSPYGRGACVGNISQPCPSGQNWYDRGNICVSTNIFCPSGQNLDSNKNTCMAQPYCPAGQNLDTNKNACMAQMFCPSGQNLDTNKNACMAQPFCQSGQNFNPQQNTCVGQSVGFDFAQSSLAAISSALNLIAKEVKALMGQ